MSDSSAQICGCEACNGEVKHISWCAVHRAPAEPAGHCDCGALLPEDSPARDVLAAFDFIEHDLAFIGGCTLTDRPDLPLSPGTSWKMDFKKQRDAISAARAIVCEMGAAIAQLPAP